MQKRKSRSDASSSMTRSVSMQTLDKELSKHVEVARTKPVLVDRYGVPWVWIVSHPLWVEADCLKSFVPADHALVALREAIDSTLAYEGLVMSELTAQCTSGVDARMITRAWLLQIVYSLADPKRVRECLGYNMLWRWFVGYVMRSESLPEPQAFIQDMKMVSAHSRVIDIVYRCLSHDVLLNADAGEFCINHGLLRTLRAHHFEMMSPPTCRPPTPAHNERGREIVTE